MLVPLLSKGNTKRTLSPLQGTWRFAEITFCCKQCKVLSMMKRSPSEKESESRYWPGKAPRVELGLDA